MMTLKSIKVAACTALTATTVLLAPASTAQAGAEPFIGEIMAVGFNFCPRSWAKADGQLIAIAQNTALFSLLGTNFGGDGRTTFGLPDLRGRVAIHNGNGPGLPAIGMGQKGGTPNNTLAAANMPAHKHGVSVATNVTATQKAITTGSSASAANQYIASGAPNGFGSRGAFETLNAGSITATAVSTVTENPVGSGAAVNNMQPFLGVNYCIALQGIFPSRN